MSVKNTFKILIPIFLVVLLAGCKRSDLSSPDSMLISAAKDGDVKLLQLAIAKGADINTTDDRGGTALHWAVYYGHEDIVKILLLHGANPFLEDKNGISPYRLAQIKGKSEILDLIDTYRKRN
ncbi:ankyrin repeat domain-containing protein [Persephonella sp.]